MNDQVLNLSTLLQMTTDIVEAYAKRNDVSPARIAEIVDLVFVALRREGGQTARAAYGPRPKVRWPVEPSTGNRAAPLVPAVPIQKSITPDYLICLEDGQKRRVLKRHLRSVYGMAPEEYRRKWGLPADYPMVAPRYAALRSRLSKAHRFGRQPLVEAPGDNQGPFALSAAARQPMEAAGR
jgi:predicted transcriptional regulator